MALEEENRRLLSDLQQAFENLRQDRAEAAEKEGEARVAGEEASRAALDRLRQTVDELRADLQDERERFEAARRAAEEAGKEEAARVAGEESSRAALEQLRQTVDELRADLKNERKRFESTSLNAGKGAKEAPPESEPEPPAAEFDDGGSVIAILGGGLFGSGENIVTSELEQAVQRALPAIVTRPSSSIIVEGHTDSQPLSRNLARQFGNNSTLSLMRAQTVADILIRAGVESSRITSVGFGGTRPIAPNRTPDGRAENRRVEIRLVPPGAMPAARTDVPEGE
jgi:chemotaxis protein MotB